MSIILSENHYGQTRVRVVRLIRQPDRHDVKELTLDIEFEGDFSAAHVVGDNRLILPTDAIRNTVYGLIKEDDSEQLEVFSARLAEYFVRNTPSVWKAHVQAAEHPWARVVTGGKPHPHTFVRGGSGERRVTIVSATADHTSIKAGIENMLVLKTGESSFEGYMPDPFTTSKETNGGILATAITAVWAYSEADVAFGPCWHGVRQLLLDTFAQHRSRSAQHMLYAMGEAVLEAFDEIVEIKLSLPDRSCVLVDLSPFGMENKGEVFLPLDEPRGVIEASLRKE
jgi:urate oxidase